ncbi:MAG: hypothetical protein Q7U54_08280 [Bacteroidales bacterium]|nr:hypothetical protein [Bacteroidales bacterium]
MKNSPFVLSFYFMPVLTSCGDNSSDSDTEGSSLTGSSSHNTGKNCLGCHSFKAAGSVYSQALTSVYSGAAIKFTSASNGTGTILATLTSDRTGNYYTSNSISFGTGNHVSVTETVGTV